MQHSSRTHKVKHSICYQINKVKLFGKRIVLLVTRPYIISRHGRRRHMTACSVMSQCGKQVPYQTCKPNGLGRTGPKANNLVRWPGLIKQEICISRQKTEDKIRRSRANGGENVRQHPAEEIFCIYQGRAHRITSWLE